MSGKLKPRPQLPAPGSPTSLKGTAYVDHQFDQAYPLLTDFLQQTAWDKGKGRIPGTLILFCEEGSFKFCVNDKDSLQVAFVSKPTFKELLEAVERGLRDDSLDWRLSTEGKKKFKR